MDNDLLKQALAHIGRIGGKSTSDRKRASSRLNAAKATEARLKRQKPVKGHRIAPNEHITD
jgi:hypothetical protein